MYAYIAFMGISGLLPFLKKASCPVHIKEFSGYTVAVDAYCWLHKSSYSCAMDLALGNPTDQYVRYTLKYLNLLLSCNIKPILVFDGANLPSKADTDLKRRENKEAYRKKAAEFLLQGNREAAQECFQRSVFVTPQMAQDVLQAARNLGVDCIVAPYEADAQLAYLNRAGYADLVVTEDSDLLLFGCRQVIFKLDLTGSGILVAITAGIGELCCGMRPDQFTDVTLRYMGILTGCDYFSGIPGIGLSTAAKILRQTRLTDFREILTKLGMYTKLSATALAAFIGSANEAQCARANAESNKRCRNGEVVKRLHHSLIDAAVRAERTFRLQVVFDPLTRSQRRLSDPTPEDVADEIRMTSAGQDDWEVNKENLFSFAGRIAADSVRAFQVALGNQDFRTGSIVDSFDPDNAQSCPPALSRPRSDSSVLHHFSRPSQSPSPVRHVLGQLGSNTVSAMDASRHPNRKRLRMSIWDRNFPTQKVWIHRRANNDDGQSPLYCLTVSTVSPTKPVPDTVRNANTICTELSEEFERSSPRPLAPTLGKQLVVANRIADSLLRFKNNKRSAEPVTNTATVEKRLRRSPEPPDYSHENNSIADIIDTYKPPRVDQSATPVPQLVDRGLLSSTVLSSSNYFPKKCPEDNSSLLIPKSKTEDDVACALQRAAVRESQELNDAVLRSPVFNRNPFRIQPTNAHAVNVISPLCTTPPQKSRLCDTDCRPAFVEAGRGATSETSEMLTQSSSENGGSPTFLSSVQIPPTLQFCTTVACEFQPDTPPPSNPPEEDASPMSPNFLDSHIARSASCLTPDTPKSTRCPRQSHQIGCLKLSPSNPRLGRTHMDKSALTRLSTRVSMRGTRHPNGLSSNNTRFTPPAQAQRNMTLHSYFKQWQFKDTD